MQMYVMDMKGMINTFCCENICFDTIMNSAIIEASVAFMQSQKYPDKLEDCLMDGVCLVRIDSFCLHNVCLIG